MTRQESLLALKPHRFALIWTAAGCLIVAGAAASVAVWLATYAVPTGCADLAIRNTAACGGYPEALVIDHLWAARAMAVMGLLPFVMGTIVGVPVVAAEIESRTAIIAWSLDPSRRRWFVVRMVGVGSVLGLLLMVPAAAGNLLERFRVPRWDPSTTVYLDFGSRGWPLVERGLATFAVAVTVGLVVGRVLPALVVAGLLAAVLLGVLNAAHSMSLPEPTQIAARPNGYVLPVGGTRSMYADAAGKLYSPEQIRAAAPAPVGTPEFFAWFEGAGFTQVQYGISGERLWVVEVRELAAVSAAVAVLLAAAASLVRTRRPY
jgi:hypothetical protein